MSMAMHTALNLLHLDFSSLYDGQIHTVQM